MLSETCPSPDVAVNVPPGTAGAVLSAENELPAVSLPLLEFVAGGMPETRVVTEYVPAVIVAWSFHVILIVYTAAEVVAVIGEVPEHVHTDGPPVQSLS